MPAWPIRYKTSTHQSVQLPTYETFLHFRTARLVSCVLGARRRVCVPLEEALALMHIRATNRLDLLRVTRTSTSMCLNTAIFCMYSHRLTEPRSQMPATQGAEVNGSRHNVRAPADVCNLLALLLQSPAGDCSVKSRLLQPVVHDWQ